MAPQAKRRKRNVVESDDDDDAQPPRKNSVKDFFFSSPDPKTRTNATNPAASPSPLRKTTRSGTTDAASSNGVASPSKGRRPSKSATTPVGTPEKKGRGQKKIKVEEKGKTADLLVLFSKQSQKAQNAGSANGQRPPPSDRLALEDIASDPISEDDEVTESKAAASSFVGKMARKRLKDSSQPSSSSSFTATSQRFLRPPKLSSAPPPPADEDLRPWSERFAPLNLDELAVHKKKVADVRKWLHDVIGGGMRQRLLILKGAAGSGKTTTVHLLAKEMKIEVLEWKNPAGSLGAHLGYSSASAQFEEFMTRGGRFGQLDLDSDDGSPTGGSMASAAANGTTDSSQKIILVEEFPNTFMKSSTALTLFRSTILSYLAANTPSLATFGQQHSQQEPVTPIVMIISETLLTTTSASADSFTAHRLLGPEILRHPGTGIIEFNAIAPTILARALELVVQKEARKSGRRKTPGPQVLRRLGEIGDIRNAIASLEFLCVKGDDDADWGARVVFTKSKKGPKDVALTRSEEETLELVSQREASLGIFHAVGKVVYNKRDESASPSTDAAETLLPDYLAHCARPKRSQVAVDSLMDETGTDTHTFISALHENYALSCEPPSASDPYSALDYISECIEYLSESDLLCPTWDSFFGGKGFAGGYNRDMGSHILRQDEIAFQLSVRGLLFALPSPVKRLSTGSARGGDQFKMFYPTSLKLWRAREELDSLIDVWASKMLQGEMMQTGPAAAAAQPPQNSFTSGAVAFRRAKGGSVGDWATNRSELGYAAKVAAAKKEAEKNDSPQQQPPPPPPLLSLGSSARQELLLERLPYMAHIARRRKCSFLSMGTRELDKVVSFQGIGVAANEESEDEGDDNANGAGEAWATDKPTEEATPRKKKLGAIRTRSDESDALALTGGLQINKLVLSDDDIEDD